jgi:hypothetical protein
MSSLKWLEREHPSFATGVGSSVKVKTEVKVPVKEDKKNANKFASAPSVPLSQTRGSRLARAALGKTGAKTENDVKEVTKDVTKVPEFLSSSVNYAIRSVEMDANFKKLCQYVETNPKVVRHKPSKFIELIQGWRDTATGDTCHKTDDNPNCFCYSRETIIYNDRTEAYYFDEYVDCHYCPLHYEESEY